jgi:hypothetical protein
MPWTTQAYYQRSAIAKPRKVGRVAKKSSSRTTQLDFLSTRGYQSAIVNTNWMTSGMKIEERFGELPEQADHLFETTRIVLECQRMGVSTIDAGPDSIAATLPIGLLYRRLKLSGPKGAINCRTGVVQTREQAGGSIGSRS